MDLTGQKVLVVDDEATICEILAASLGDEGCVVKTAHNGVEALKVLQDFKPSVMLLDVWMPGDLDGLGVLEAMSSLTEIPKVVVMSGHGTIDTAVKAVKLGAWDFVEKPVSIEKVLITIKNIVSFSIQENEKQSLLNQLRESFVIAGESPHIQQIKSLVMRLGATQSAYLLQGEEGVGKSLVARNVHYVSKRAGFPFVSVNCMSLPEGLHQVELWGEENKNLGLFQAAEGGTLFLKNIENLDLDTQDLLAAYLRDRESGRAGSVRLVASTSASLADKIKEGVFREDLYRRLSALSLEVKPLAERKEDVPILVEHFSNEYCRKAGVTVRNFREDAMKLLTLHDWPGNILELKNFVERVHILSTSEQFDVYDVNYAGISPANSQDFNGYGNFREARAQFEKDYLLAKIAENDGNISKTSEAIGLERSYLHRKIKAYGIEIDNKR
jgi:two-component system nitrogen regulation response regulator NtrX